MKSVTDVFVRDDGGRAEAGYRGTTGDCACRAVAIVAERPYQEVYDELIEFARLERPRGKRQRSHPRTGYWSETLKRYLAEHGFTWTPTMEIGSGTKVHFKADEMPNGRLVVRLSRHYTAMVDGVIHDTFDASREGTRCVYGYWTAP